MNRPEILLEDREIFGTNLIHKNVLKSSENVYQNKAKIYDNPSEQTEFDHMKINPKLLEFVTDGIRFEENVVESTALYALPYSSKYAKQIFDNKSTIANDLILDPNKYKRINKRNLSLKFNSNREKISKGRENSNDQLISITDKSDNNQIEEEETCKPAHVTFKPLEIFSHMRSLSNSDSNLAEFDSFYLRDDDDQATKRSRSLDSFDGFMENKQLVLVTKTAGNEQETINKTRGEEKYFKETKTQIGWDEYLIDLLSENTARYLVMKKVSNPNTQKKLMEFVERKYGRYTRDIRYLDLIEDSLTDYEKRKIAEEKERVRQVNSNQMGEKFEESKQDSEEVIPLYRMPVGLKRIELENLKKPDSSFNKTVRNLKVRPSKIKSPKTYEQDMRKKNVTDMTLYRTTNGYEMQMINGSNKHLMIENKDQIMLENGEVFRKAVQPVYPAEFTEWIHDVKLNPNNKPELKKPSKGRKKWKKLPELIENNVMNNPYDEKSTTNSNNFWHLLPTTSNLQLKKVLKSNLTVSRLVDEWRRRWQTSSRWKLADINELIRDMNHERANVRFLAVVVCSRAAEQFQLMIDKTAKFKKASLKSSTKLNELDEDDHGIREFLRSANKISSTDNIYFYDFFFPEHLFSTITTLLDDINSKVKLAAAIAIFTILKKFIRPLMKNYQEGKDKADKVLREILVGYFDSADKYAAALSLAIDGQCNQEIIQILLNNYFNSEEQYTREQVAQILSELSSTYVIINETIEKYLSDEHARERILACKLLPCLRRPLNKSTIDKLVDLMWNDINHVVRRVAAQTLGLTGKSRIIHEELVKRLKSLKAFDRVAALKILKYVSIMTDKILPLYIKCFRDDYISVRRLACQSSRYLNEKHPKIIDSLVFMARFDRVPNLKSLAIQTLGLIGEINLDIHKCLIWALQYEFDPQIRSNACHTLMLLTKKTTQPDQELVELLQERYLIESEPIVRKELMETLNHIGYDSNKDLPVVAKLKDDVSKLNDKKEIIRKIAAVEKQLNFENDKKQFIWIEEESLPDKTKNLKISQSVLIFLRQRVTFITSSSIDGKIDYFDKLDSISTFIERKISQQNQKPGFLDPKQTKSNKNYKKTSASDSKSSGSSSFLSKLMLQEELGEDFDEPLDLRAENNPEINNPVDDQPEDKLQFNQRSIEQTKLKEKQGKVCGSTGIRTPSSLRITTIQEE